MKKTETQGRTFTIPHETYTWFLVPAAFLLILSCMVKIRLKPQLALTPLLLVCFCFSQQLQAADKSAEHPSLKQKWIDEGIQHRQALKSLEAKKYKEAIKAFSKASSTATGETLAELHYGIAESHYQAAAYSHAQRHYAHALLHPSKPLQAHASYNLANSLFQQTWSKLQPPESTPFKDHLRQQMEKMKASEKDLPFDKSTLNQASVQWKEALEYYQFSYQTDATLSKAKSNEETVLKLLKELNEVLNEKPEKKEPDCKDPKDSEKNIPKDKKTDKPKDKDGDTPKQKDGEKGEPKDKGQKDPNKDGKGEPKEQSQKPKDGKGDKSNKDTEPKDGDKDGKGEKVDPNKPLEEQLNPDPNQSPEDFARNALEKLSDEQHNPKKLTIKKDFRTKNDW